MRQLVIALEFRLVWLHEENGNERYDEENGRNGPAEKMQPIAARHQTGEHERRAEATKPRHSMSHKPKGLVVLVKAAN